MGGRMDTADDGKILMVGKIEGKRRRGQQKIRRLDSLADLMDMNLSKLWEAVEDGGVWHVVSNTA